MRALSFIYREEGRRRFLSTSCSGQSESQWESLDCKRIDQTADISVTRQEISSQFSNFGAKY